MLGDVSFHKRATSVFVQTTGQVVGCRYCSHEVPPGWYEVKNTRSLVHSNQPLESQWVTCQPTTCGLHPPIQ